MEPLTFSIVILKVSIALMCIVFGNIMQGSASSFYNTGKRRVGNMFFVISMCLYILPLLIMGSLSYQSITQ